MNHNIGGIYMELVMAYFTIQSVIYFNFNLFSIYLIREGYDPSDMELVNTEIMLHMSYMSN
jgi:hypothetical protein